MISPRVIRHSKQTGPQAEFWASTARFVLMVGGVGSGKTRAGCVKALTMPTGSTGMVVAPTYPMLRDATLRTFLDLVEPAGILREFNKSEMRVTLAGNRTILFRSGDRPDRLRGPNIGWFWLDEAAMLVEDVWLIMLGRRREQPAIAWCTSTPRGKNWLYKTFIDAGPDFAVVRASSRTNTFLPPDFVRTLEASYTPTFAAQEVDGSFLDDVFDQLIPDVWIDRLPTLVRPKTTGGPRWISCDLGEGGGRDSTVILVGDHHGILHGHESAWDGPVQAAKLIADLVRTWDVRQDRIVYDAGGGRGLDLDPYLEAHGITDAVPYKGSREGGAKFVNRRTKVAWLMRQRLDPEKPLPPPALAFDGDREPSVFDPEPVVVRENQPPFCLPADREWWPLLEEELKALFWFHKGKKISLELKEDMMKRLKRGRSPNVLDALLMRFQLDQEV